MISKLFTAVVAAVSLV
jgi:leukotriene-A4 hydrolase